MLSLVYSRLALILKQIPVRLWGTSLMCSLLVTLASLFGVLPIISIPIATALEFGMCSIYLVAYSGKPFVTEQLFLAFKKNRFLRIVGGILWAKLWILIWSLIPVVGIVFGIIKAYSYRFVPYILLTDPETGATQAIKKSIAMTKGHRGAMFGCDLLLVGIVFALTAILLLFVNIRFVGVIFAILLVLFLVAAAVILPLASGLLDAGYFYEVSSGHLKQTQQSKSADISNEPAQMNRCNICGTLTPGAFCTKCGAKVK